MLDKRSNASKPIAIRIKLQTATASQVASEKDNLIELQCANRSMDKRIKNFDVSFGNKLLPPNANGRRCGLLGCNSPGKTTLLRMVSGKQLHISVLWCTWNEKRPATISRTALDTVPERVTELNLGYFCITRSFCCAYTQRLVQNSIQKTNRIECCTIERCLRLAKISLE